MTTIRWYTRLPLRNISNKIRLFYAFLALIAFAIILCLRLTTTATIEGGSPLATPVPIDVLWYTNMEQDGGAQGFILESINFMLPLYELLSFGWYGGGSVSDIRTNTYFQELSDKEQRTMLDLFVRGAQINHDLTISNNVISITFEQPIHYKELVENTRMKHSVYKIGRAMFETDWIPNNWDYHINEYLDEVWVPSEFAKKVFQSAGVYKPIKVIREGFDPAAFSNIVSNNTTQSRKEWFPKCQPNDLIFLAVGKMERRKGIDILVNTFKKIFTSKEPACLYIRAVLNGAQRTSLKSINTKGIRVFELSKKSPEDLISVYQTADVFVLPSHGEGWGRPIMEAMAAGLPAIVPLWSGITEFVKPEYSLSLTVNKLELAFAGESWFLGGKRYQPLHHWAAINTTELGELLKWCLGNRPKLKEIGLRGKEAMFAGFTREKVARDVVTRIDEIKAEIQPELEALRRRNEQKNKIRDAERRMHRDNNVNGRLEHLEDKLNALHDTAKDIGRKVDIVDGDLIRYNKLAMMGADDEEEESPAKTIYSKDVLEKIWQRSRDKKTADKQTLKLKDMVRSVRDKDSEKGKVSINDGSPNKATVT